MIFEYFIILILGLTFGSFLTAFTYRFPRGISIMKGRSKCPGCKKTISARDNIPVISYLLLKGKCGKCGKEIAHRYPIIEASTAIIFLLVYYFFSTCSASNPMCEISNVVGVWALPYFLLLAIALVAIFVIDLEHMIIPDEITFFILGVSVLLFLTFNIQMTLPFFIGLSVASFLLILNLATLGNGMGLGDVKLAIPLGFILSWPSTLTWVFGSFIIGSVVGLAFIGLGKAKFGKHIPFGPFLIASFFIALFFGNLIPNFPF